MRLLSLRCRSAAAALAALLLCGTALAQAPAEPRGPPPPGYGDAYAGKKKVLVIGDLHTGNQNAHDALSHAIATIEQLGRSSGAYVSFLRTDTQWITKDEVWGMGDYAKGGPRQARGRNLDSFDAVVFYTNGETEMTAVQKQALLAYVRDEGKGFVAIHTANIPYPSWQDYARMISANWDNHPWGIVEARLRVERPDFPGLAALPRSFMARDEFYQYTAPFTRDDVDVLVSIDTSSVDLTNRNVHRADHDFPQVWAKRYGKGRVFSSALGHTDASWDDPNLQRIVLEGIKWAIGSSSYEPKPHAAP